MMQSNTPYLPILIIDDEPQTLQGFELILCSAGIENTICCEHSEKVPEILEKNDIGVVLLDLSMPGLTGEEILKIISEDYPHIPVIIITGFNEVETAVKCMKYGAFDYMVKPVEKSRLISGLKRAIELRELRNEYDELSKRMLSRKIEHPEAFFEIITNHPKMFSVFQYVETIARSSNPVLITGETGVGKELIARAVHALSGRKGLFVSVNIAGLDDNMFSDTLFGHVRGAFTGADSVRSGLVEKASGGTLFLDEIGDISAPSQVKLLRLLQEREYFPMGSDVAKITDSRIIASTNLDLSELKESNAFRKDLYYRIKTHSIYIPPLRERISDIPILVDFFIEKAAANLKKKKPTPPAELLTLLSTYHFPGNIRELQAMINDAVGSHKSGKLSLKTFEAHILKEGKSKIIESKKQDAADNLFQHCNTLPTLKEVSSLLIEEALRRSNNNQSLAAKLLGITQSGINKKISRAAEKEAVKVKKSG